MKQSIFATLALFFLLGLGACDRDEGPVEEAAESMDEAGEEIADEVDDATDER